MAVYTAICRKCGKEIFKTYLYKPEGTWLVVRPLSYLGTPNTCKPHEPAQGEERSS